ncbi:fibronectin type III domain-containing protein [Pseudomonadota bacterium]
MKNRFISLVFLLCVLSIAGCGGGGDSAVGGGGSGGGSDSTSATLSWVAPTERTDDSALALNEIGGYRIYKGTSASDVSLAVDISDPSVTEYEFTNLEKGTHYFAICAYSTDDVESEISGVVSKTI